MENKILEMVASYGVFAMLFCYLLFYVLKENAKREGNYQAIVKENQSIIGNLTETLQKDVTVLCKDVGEIKEKIFK